MNRTQVLVFDMDGVLVDVTESYRETIVRTVEHFTGKIISREQIQDYKNAGGWNNDWALSQKICRDLGVEVDIPPRGGILQRLFLAKGLIHRERWLPRERTSRNLSERFDLAIFTGRNAGSRDHAETRGHAAIVLPDDLLRRR